MAGVVQKEKTREEVKSLPRIERVEKLYHPIAAISRGAEHIRIHPEGTYPSSREGDLAATISRNISELKLGTASLFLSRFARMLEAV